MFLRNSWYVVAEAKEIGRALMPRTVLGEPLVFFRTEAGAPVAMLDRCLHREAPLSFGRLIGDTVQCGYHGITYDACGKCVRIPGQAAIPQEAVVRTYPLVERWGWVFIWMGDAARAATTPLPDFHWRQEEGWVSCGNRMVIPGNYLLVVDNLLDLSHVSYLHPRTIGTDTVAEEGIATRRTNDGIRIERWIEATPAPPIWPRMRDLGADGAPVDRWQLIDFRPPSHIVIESGGAPAGSGARSGNRATARVQMILNAITPETETSTHYFWASSRHYKLDDDEITRYNYKAICDTFVEDQEMIGGQQRVMGLGLDDYVLDRQADAGAMQARRMVERLIAEEQAAG